MKLVVENFKPTLTVDFKRSNRKSLAISVYPDQSVEAISPHESCEQEVIGKILKRRRWILKQQKHFKQLQSHEQTSLVMTGAELFYLGRQYQLRIQCCDQIKNARLHGRYLDVPVINTEDKDVIKRRISHWYRQRASCYLPKRYELLKAKLAHLNLPISKLRISLMKTRWGSCTAKGSITLNPLLVLAPSSLIDYVITHELCHLKHPNHSKEFYVLLTQTLPEWKSLKQDLDLFGAKLKSIPSPFEKV